MIILRWGKYLYLRLPMGISGAPDIFQGKMSNVMQTLLIITMSTYDNHLIKVKALLDCLRTAKLRVNVKKSSFALHEKVSAILALKEPKNVKELRRFLGMVQYYMDVWARNTT